MEYKISINGKEYMSKDQLISGDNLREIGNISSDKHILFKLNNTDKMIEINNKDIIDLSHPGTECFYTEEPKRKF
ncbi:MAG TPA: multiubiquitin domain-containing protein [Cytophagaceae bacterium]|jgi:hypothetical protein|nr:multiubiquitin domain-containing protein [Cytophagaceae bacterium]